MQKKNIWQNKYLIPVFACLCTALWGSASPVIKIGYQIFSIDSNDIASKMVFAGTRFILAGLVVLVLAGLINKKMPIPKLKDFGGLAFLGFVQTFLQYLCLYVGLSNTTGTKGSIFSSTSGFFVVMLSPIFFRNEKLNWKKVLGCFIGLAGLLVSSKEGLDGMSGFSFMGEGMVLMAGFTGGMAFFITKKLTRTREPKVVAGWQLLIGGIMLLIVGLCCGGRIAFVSVDCYLIMLYLVFLASTAFTIWNLLITNNEVAKVSIYNLFKPVSGAIISAIILKENIFDIHIIMAIILIAVGVWLVNRPIKNKNKNNPPSDGLEKKEEIIPSQLEMEEVQ